MQPIADRLPLVVQTAQPIEFAGRVGAFQIEPCPAKQGKLRRGSVDVPDAGPAARQLSLIAAANRPVETLVMLRTSSMGADVPPPVTSTFMGCPVLSCLLHATGDAELA